MVEGEGFEPPKPFRTPDLQSGGFNHSPTPPGMGIFAHFHGPVQYKMKDLIPVPWCGAAVNGASGIKL